jgi:hypothetical protein
LFSCEQCDWTGDTLAEALAHAKQQPGHTATEHLVGGDPDDAEATASQLEQRAAKLLSEARDIRARAGSDQHEQRNMIRES